MPDAQPSLADLMPGAACWIALREGRLAATVIAVTEIRDEEEPRYTAFVQWLGAPLAVAHSTLFEEHAVAQAVAAIQPGEMPPGDALRAFQAALKLDEGRSWHIEVQLAGFDLCRIF